MAQKTVWMTWMVEGESRLGPRQLSRQLQRSGLRPAGAMWIDDLDKLAWKELGDLLSERHNTDLWLIVTDQAAIQRPTNRYALSLLLAQLHESRQGLPIFLLGLDYKPEAEQLPTLLRCLPMASVQQPVWPAKVVAAAYRRATFTEPDYRLSVRADPFLGLWLEVGPRHGPWHGVMLGTHGGEIVQHAVGRKGALPQRSVVDHPLKGIRAQVGDTEFMAWSAQNDLSENESYFVRIKGLPEKLLVGGHAAEDEADVQVVELR